MGNYKTDISKIKVGMKVFHTVNHEIAKVLSIDKEGPTGLENAINVVKPCGKTDTWYANVVPATHNIILTELKDADFQIRDLRRIISNTKDALSDLPF